MKSNYCIMERIAKKYLREKMPKSKKRLTIDPGWNAGELEISGHWLTNKLSNALENLLPGLLKRLRKTQRAVKIKAPLELSLIKAYNPAVIARVGDRKKMLEKLSDTLMTCEQMRNICTQFGFQSWGRFEKFLHAHGYTPDWDRGHIPGDNDYIFIK